jgi:single-strand DNA-binding protein
LVVTRNSAGQGRVGQRPSAEADPSLNEVALVGRIAAEPVERTLPSGDVLLTWRVVVDRPPPRRPVPEGVRVPVIDTLDCVAFAASVRRTARAFTAGDVVRVDGALRRRFWRAGAITSSRYEVEVGAVKRLHRAAA